MHRSLIAIGLLLLVCPVGAQERPQILHLGAVSPNVIGITIQARRSEISRAKLIDPTQGQLNQRGGVCWSHPAYAYKHIYIRNDKELICADLSAQ